MSVILRVTLGTINFTDYVHVTASKVSAPSVVVWEDWIDTPVTNYNFIIPSLDPENYYIRFYDAPTNVALGTLQMEILVNALTGEFIFERRFYTCGGPGTYDPADGATGITDPYLVGKNVSGVFKEGFRYYDPATETTFDDTTGNVEIINGTTLSTFEKLIIEIKYADSSGSATSTGLYGGTITVTAATATLLVGDINKRVRFNGSASTQVITLPPLFGLAADDGYYLDNSIGGVAKQVKLLFTGSDLLRYNGFMTGLDTFDEFWVPKGEHILIRKYDDSYWELISEYKGVNVGERVAAGFKDHPGLLVENGQLVDGDEYPRLWWWIENVLPSTHKYVSNVYDVTDPAFNWTLSDFRIRVGQFILHPTLKKFRMPNTQGISEKGLANFTTYGSDTTNRFIDYPGGFQEQMILGHGHTLRTSDSASSANDGADPVRSSQPGTINSKGAAAVNALEAKSIGFTGGVEQRVKNIGVIYCRRT